MRAAFFLFASSLLGAADLTGIWVGQLERPNRDPIDMSFQLKQTGTKIEGKMYGDYASTPILEGSVDGDKVRFVVIAQEQAGNQINETRLTFEGLFTNGALELTRERGPSRNAANGGETLNKPNNNPTKLPLKLKRLL